MDSSWTKLNFQPGIKELATKTNATKFILNTWKGWRCLSGRWSSTSVHHGAMRSVNAGSQWKCSATIAVAKLRGVDRNHHIPPGGVKHRPFCGDQINGVKFYNDSKSTNILATQKPCLIEIARLSWLLGVGYQSGKWVWTNCPPLDLRNRPVILIARLEQKRIRLVWLMST